jgi:hypothetical protein
MKRNDSWFHKDRDATDDAMRYIHGYVNSELEEQARQGGDGFNLAPGKYEAILEKAESRFAPGQSRATRPGVQTVQPAQRRATTRGKKTMTLADLPDDARADFHALRRAKVYNDTDESKDIALYIRDLGDGA